MSVRKKYIEQPCWSCEYAVPVRDGKNYPWAEHHRPVKGWDAEKTEYKVLGCIPETTYKIYSCPMFKLDDHTKKYLMRLEEKCIISNKPMKLSAQVATANNVKTGHRTVYRGGNGIQIQRVIRNIQAGELAKEMGVSQKTVTLWENGLRLPEQNQYERIAKYFGCTVGELLRKYPTPAEVIRIKRRSA